MIHTPVQLFIGTFISSAFSPVIYHQQHISKITESAAHDPAQLFYEIIYIIETQIYSVRVIIIIYRPGKHRLTVTRRRPYKCYRIVIRMLHHIPQSSAYKPR